MWWGALLVQDCAVFWRPRGPNYELGRLRDVLSATSHRGLRSGWATPLTLSAPLLWVDIEQANGELLGSGVANDALNGLALAFVDGHSAAQLKRELRHRAVDRAAVVGDLGLFEIERGDAGHVQHHGSPQTSSTLNFTSIATGVSPYCAPSANMMSYTMPTSSLHTPASRSLL